VRIGKLWIGPPWERPPAEAVPVVIDPGRAFGTGAHPTTRLCAEWLLDLEATSVLDVGCGSGVLAIVAARLGFEPVVAVDDDPAAIDATERNARANGVCIVAKRADALRDSLPPAEIVIANISAETLVALAPRLATRTLVTSGYGADSPLALNGFTRAGCRVSEGWAADLWQRPQ
jgi:ribosomal protein L11 methyltransferase